MGLAHGIGIGIPFKRSSGSWSSYWSRQPEVLFFGLYSEIADGKMPNKVPSATDYLTVAGSAGSETYQVPNTAPYQTADTDYIWFNSDASQRTVTTAELVGYDLQRTPVKYGDTSPNALVAIMILNAVVTGAKRDKLFQDMWLPILWDDSLNAYGHIKSNRTGQQLWTPETITILSDTFTDTDNVHLHDHTMDLGTGWTAPVNFIISGNKLVFSGASTATYGFAESGKSDVDITMDVDMQNQQNYFGGFTFRYKDDSNNWCLYIQRDGGGTPYLKLTKNGVQVDTKNITQETATNKLRVVCLGNNISCYWKNLVTPLIATTDATNNAETKHGVFGGEVSGYVMPVMDNFKIIG